MAEFEQFGRRLAAGELSRPDVVVIALDADCDPGRTRAALAFTCDLIKELTCVVVCVPHPYIERWYLLDLSALRDVLGHGPAGAWPMRCDKDYYKIELERLVDDAGFDSLLGGYEFADQIVPEMDLVQAGRDEPELARFVEDLRACFRRFQLSAAPG